MMRTADTKKPRGEERRNSVVMEDGRTTASMDDWKLGQTYQSSAGEVRWDRLGPAGGPPVVLNHGTPFSSYVWRAVARTLARDYEVFVWDMPGYGASEQFIGQDVSLDAQGRVFAELLTSWERDPPFVVAHDFGGAVALRAMLLHGARYRRMVLVDPVATRPWGSPFFRLVREHWAVFEQLPAELHRALVREYVAGSSSSGLSEAILDRLVEPWLGADGQPAFYRQIAQADQRYTDEIQDRYGSIDIPVLICWGTDDTWTPWTRGSELAAAIPNARFQRIDGAGHLVQEDAHHELSSLIGGFLAEPDLADPGARRM
jgi:pimeloyl-ACP methyl ester carboxylesterase